MTDQQLYLAIGIPFFSILVGIWANMWQVSGIRREIDSKFETVDAKFEAVNARFDAVNTKFDAVNSRLDALNGKLDLLREDVRLLTGKVWELMEKK